MSLFVDRTGTRGAPSIVFLHGIGASGWMWGRQVAALSDFDCLNVDLPGHGKSNDVPWISLADTADQIAVIIQTQATHGRAHVVGLSLGGYVALVLLDRHTSALDHVVIDGVTFEPMPNRVWLEPQLALTTFLFKRRWFANMQARAMNIAQDMQSAFTENLLATSMDAYRSIYREAAVYAVPASLSHVNTPTLITAGGSESKVIVDAVPAIARLMPNAQGRLAPGLDHGWNVQAPDLFSAMVRAWLTGAPLPAGLQAVSKAN